MNIFNYQYTDFDMMLKRIDNIMDKARKLEEHNTKTEITIKKSIHGYWNLKLKIMNNERIDEKDFILNQRVA